MHCWNGNPYVAVDVDNDVRGAPAGDPQQPKTLEYGIPRDLLCSGAVAGERAEEPHQQGTRSESMDRRRHPRARRGDDGPDYKRLGKALVSILRHDHPDQWLTIDDLLERLHGAHPRSAVEQVLAEDTRRFMCRSRGVEAGGWVVYEYSARPKKQR